MAVLRAGRQELHHEFVHTLGAYLARLAAAADTRCYTTREGCLVGFGRAPLQAIAVAQAGAGLHRLFGHPHGDDVVFCLVVAWQLDELDRAFAPVVLRLDPQAGAAIVAHAIEVMIEGPIAL